MFLDQLLHFTMSSSTCLAAILALRWCLLSVEREEEQKSVNRRVAKGKTALCDSETSETVDGIFPRLNAVFSLVLINLKLV